MCLVAAGATPPAFPHYMQCDSRWGGDQMGVDGPGERDTVCHQGCAMSCVAMALAGYNLTLPGQQSPPTPGSLNKWLTQNHGYHCDGGNCNNLVLDAPDLITAGMMRVVGEWGGRCCGGDAAKPPLETIKSGLATASDRHLVFIAHVHNNHHFVLLTGWDDDQSMFTALDPNYPPLGPRVPLSVELNW